MLVLSKTDLSYQLSTELRQIDDSAKGGLTQFWELFTMIPYAPKYLKCE